MIADSIGRIVGKVPPSTLSAEKVILLLIDADSLLILVLFAFC